MADCNYLAFHTRQLAIIILIPYDLPDIMGRGSLAGIVTAALVLTSHAGALGTAQEWLHIDIGSVSAT